MKIAITGTSHYWGKRMLNELLHDAEVRSIVALDTEPPETDSSKVRFTRLTYKRPFHKEWIKKLKAVKPDVLLMCPFGPEHCYHDNNRNHLNWTQNSLRVLLTGTTLGIPRIVILSSAIVYGALNDNPALITEDGLLLGDRHYQRIRGMIELEEAALAVLAARSSPSSIAILRTVTTLGSTVENFMVHFCRLPVVPVVLGFDPVMQFTHEDDVIHATLVAIRSTARGPFNIASTGVITRSELFRTLEKKAVPIFHPFVHFFSKRLWAMNLSEFSPAFMALLRYRIVVDTKRASNLLKFHPKHSVHDAVSDLKARLEKEKLERTR